MVWKRESEKSIIKRENDRHVYTSSLKKKKEKNFFFEGEEATKKSGLEEKLFGEKNGKC